jgi:VIT1/CCC1 family predicted Fe2+/Mn2+ transporter
MADTHNEEKHFTNSEVVRDVVIGMADGLTVPFALAAGISGAVDSIHLIVIAGLAEIAAGAIAMGLGGYLAARTYEEHYSNERKRELYEIDFLTEKEREETREIFRYYGIDGGNVEVLIKNLEQNKSKWADFMMRYELGMEEPNTKRAPISAITIGGSYIVGGLIPLSSYMLINDIQQALFVSVISTLSALGIFGAVKGRLTGINPFKAAIQTMLVGGMAAAVAYGIAKYISS